MRYQLGPGRQRVCQQGERRLSCALLRYHSPAGMQAELFEGLCRCEQQLNFLKGLQKVRRNSRLLAQPRKQRQLSMAERAVCGSGVHLAASFWQAIFLAFVGELTRQPVQTQAYRRPWLLRQVYEVLGLLFVLFCITSFGFSLFWTFRVCLRYCMQGSV